MKEKLQLIMKHLRQEASRKCGNRPYGSTSMADVTGNL